MSGGKKTDKLINSFLAVPKNAVIGGFEMVDQTTGGVARARIAPDVIIHSVITIHLISPNSSYADSDPNYAGRNHFVSAIFLGTLAHGMFINFHFRAVASLMGFC